MNPATTKRRISTVLALSIISSLGLSACSQTEDVQESASSVAAEASAVMHDEAQYPRTVKTLDAQGKETEITLDAQPKRIVSASVTLTGSLLSLDAPVVASGGGKPGSTFREDGFANQWAEVADQHNVESLWQLEPNAEKVLAQQPDLVIMSNVGQDKATDIYEQLAAVVPVIVVDYSKMSWQEVTTELGADLGLEDKAEEVIASYDSRVKELAASLKKPEGPVNIISQSRDGGYNFFTKESAQGQLFSDLGIEVAVPDRELAGGTVQGSNRSDIVGVAPENLPVALEGNSIFALVNNPKQDAKQFIASIPEIQDKPAVVEGRVYDLPRAAFRIDYYSANVVLDSLESTLG